MPAFAGVAVSKLDAPSLPRRFESPRVWNHKAQPRKGGDPLLSLLWIILIVVLVLLLLGFFSRGRW
jgi:hypothetical protein